MLNVPFKERKPTLTLFDGGGIHCFPKKTSRDYEKEKPYPFLHFLRHSNSTMTELEPKKATSLLIWHKRVELPLAQEMSLTFNSYLIQLLPPSKQHDFLYSQRSCPVVLRHWSRLSNFDSKKSRPRCDNKLPRNCSASLEFVVPSSRIFEHSVGPNPNHFQPAMNIRNEGVGFRYCWSEGYGYQRQ